METGRHSGKRIWPTVALVLAAAAVLSAIALPSLVPNAEGGAPLTPDQAVQQAWERARELGSYHFRTDVEATISPAGKPEATSGVRHERLTIQGQVDLPAEKMEMMLSEKGGRMLRTAQGIELRVEGSRTYGRVGNGEWEEMEGATDAFAPGQDPLAFLAGAKEFQTAGTESRQVPVPGGMAEVSFTRFAFTMDGPAFGEYMRGQLERRLSERGELPSGMTMEVSETYRAMAGRGEIWIDGRGLPLRLTVDLEYPPQKGEQSRSHIQTDFSSFADDVATAPSIVEQPSAWAARTLRSMGLPATAEGWGEVGLRAAVVAFFLGLGLVVVARPRSRAVYVACSVAIILAMTISPLRESLRVQAAGERMEAQRQESERQQEAAQREQALKDAQRSSDWDPLKDPLAASSAGIAGAPSGGITQALITVGGVRAPLVGEETPPDPNSDGDGDGLTYQEEMRLGTDPELPSSDLDQMGDGLEVKGFDYNGKHYYTDPLSSDTINDGVADTLECWTIEPEILPANDPATQGCNLDTDQDGVLDVFDRDNDGDQVPDAVDLSPFSAMEGFSDANPFNLVVNKLQPLPVLMDVQIRPKTAAHLAYTLSVLDWPTGDTQGQVQRVLDTTFATAVDDPMTPEEIETDPRAQYGDMRLIPMLEIRVPYKAGHARNLPIKPDFTGTLTETTPLEKWLDTGKLDKYGMSAHYLDEAGTLGIYVPLNLVEDETGGSSVAWQAHFYYEPAAGGDWGNAHQMRVEWWVQMLVDQCDSDAYGALPDNPKPDFDQWCANRDNRIETAQVVHTYPEEWSLTGLSVREDHGLEASVAFEDPDYDDDVDDDTSLWQLANGLDGSFLTARDCDPLGLSGECMGDGRRDITVDEIERRWNNQTNAGIPDGLLWGISRTALQVWKEELPHQDYMITLITTTTMEILNDKFLPAAGCQKNCSTPRAAAPTVLVATEGHARTANLDLGGTTMVRGSALLTVDMEPVEVTVDTLASVSWSPYRYQDGKWEVYPLDEYMDLFGTRMETYFQKNYPTPLSEEELADQVLWARCYYLALSGSISTIVQVDGELNDADPDTIMTDVNLAIPNIVESVYRICDSISAVLAANEAFKLVVSNEIEMVDFSGGSRSDPGLPHYAGSLSEQILAQAKLGVCIAMAVTSAVFAVLAFAVDAPALPYIQAGLMLTGSVILVGMSVITLAKNVGKGFFGKVAGQMKGFTGKLGFKLAVLGTLFDIAAQVGLFIANVMTGGVDPTSIEFDAMLACLIGSLVVTVILAVIYAIPIIGDVVYAVVSALNWIFKIVCESQGEDYAETTAGSWICGGITGILAKAFTWLLFSTKPILDLEYEALDQAPPQVSLQHPEWGFQVDNELAYSMLITQTIRQTSLSQLDNWKQIMWFGQFNETNLKKSVFDYALSPAETDLHEGLSMDQETGWVCRAGEDGTGGLPHCQVEKEAISTENIKFKGAGINQSFGTYFNEGYVLPVQECWGWPLPIPIAGCGIKSIEDTVHAEIGDFMQFDVFPKSLDGFHTLQKVSGGYRLNWGGGWMEFPVQRDPDGDGLPSGADPSDATWDADGDGLSDPFEKQIGTNPNSQDSDGDGLLDYEELVKGTDPRSTDGDADSLTDQEELAGWDFVYGWVDETTPKITRVYPDPMLYDSDSDGLSDRQEWLYGWNPRVKSDGKVLTFSSSLLEQGAGGAYATTDGVVKAGDQLRFEAKVKNELDVRFARGLLDSRYPADTLSGSIDPETFVLAPREAAEIQGELTVVDGPSGPTALTQIAGAELYDGLAASAYSGLLLHLEEPADATTFWDDSGGVLRHNGNCVPATCPVRHAEGRLGQGVQFTQAGQRIDVDGVNANSGSVSVTYWMRSTYEGATTTLLRSTSDYLVMSMDGSGRACAQVRTTSGSDQTVCSANSLHDGNWHHVALVYDAQAYAEASLPGQVSLYVDSLLSEASAITRAAGQAGLQIGDTYPGYLDEVAVYGRALTASEVAASAAAVKPDRLELLLDEPAGAMAFADATGNNSGSCVAGHCPTMVARGVNRTAAEFDGMGDGIEFPHNESVSFAYNQDFSVVLWLKGEGQSGPVIQKGPYADAWPFAIAYIGDSGSVKADRSDSYQRPFVQSDVSINDGKFHHVAFVKQGGTLYLYTDGVLRSSAADTTTGTTTNSLPLVIAGGGSAGFKGAVDDVRIYGRALSQAEVQQLQSTPLDLVYLHMDDPPGTYLFEDANGRAPAGCPPSLVGCPTSGVGGRMNQGALFAAAESDHLATESALDMGSFGPGGALMAWVYPTGDGSQPQFVLGTGDGNATTPEWSIWRDGGYWAVDVGGGVVRTTLSVEPDHWQHIAAVFKAESGTAFKVYKDCNTQAAYSGLLLFPNHDNRVTIGCDGQGQSCFEGRLDEVYVRGMYIAQDSIPGFCSQAPEFGLHLDEAWGIEDFADYAESGNTITCRQGHCPAAGADGQVGLAAAFDGLHDGLTTALTLNNQPATIMAWVKPSSSTSFHQTLMASDTFPNFEIFHMNGTWQVRSGIGVLAPAQAVVRPDEWQHVAVVISQLPYKYHMELYVNGVLQPGALEVAYYTVTNAGIGFNPYINLGFLEGRIDELAVYNRALSGAEIEAIYDYQADWVEEVQRTGLTIDNDKPVASLAITPGAAIADQPYQVRIDTSDPTSAVSRAEWRVAPSGTFTEAPPCEGADYGSAWCPMFTPSGGGGYTLEARATDVAGNVSDTASAVLVVDDTAPTATLTQEGTLVRLAAATDRQNAWTASLSGTVSDPTPGSGVAAVRVALIDPLGMPVAPGSQAATVSGGNWSLAYRLDEPLPTGRYTVQLEAEDNLGNHGVDAAHSLSVDRTAPESGLDGPPPGGTLALWRLEESTGASHFADSSGMGNDAVCDGPCPPATGAGRYGNGIFFDGACSAPNCPAIKSERALAVGDTGFSVSAWFRSGATVKQTLFVAKDATGGGTVMTVKLDASGHVQYTFSPPGAASSSISTKKTYTLGIWHHVSAQWHPGQIWLYLDGQLVRIVGSVEGAPPPSLNVVVGHDAGLEPFAGTVDEVAIHGVWLTPDEVRILAFTDPAKRQNDVPLQGVLSEVETVPDAMLALHLEEAAGPFADGSVYDNDATCTGMQCPSADSGGPYGASRRFDGADDNLSIQSSSLPYLANTMTIMAWIKPERLSGVQRVLSIGPCSPTPSGIGFGTDGSGLVFSTYGVAEYHSDGVALSVNQWQHVAAVMGADNSVTFYVDGVDRGTLPGSAPAATCLGDVLIGRASTPNGAPAEAFQGTIDEVYVFNRALAAEEIVALGHKQNAGLASLQVAFTPDVAGSPLYNAPMPQDVRLYLPFDDTPRTEGNATFIDISGGGHNGSCTAPNCPVMGQTGHAGSAAFFDGKTTSVRVPQVAGEETTDYLTIAAWIYPTGAVANAGGFIARYNLWVVSCLNDGTIRWAFRNTNPGWHWKSTGYKAPLNQWTHIVVVYDAGVIRTYANGELKHTYIGSGSISNAGSLDIGGHPALDYWFAGGLDDVLLFTRALPENEIEDLFRGTEPLLHLPFDETWVVSGTLLADTSGWEHTGTMASGSDGAANKAVAGQVGAGALSFDGTDDYVNAGSQIDLANSSFSVAFWAKRNAAGRYDVALSQGTAGTNILLHVGFRNTNVFTCAFYGNDLNTPSSYLDTDWHHWTCTYDSSTNTRTIYRDGAKVAQDAAAADYQGSGELYVGRYRTYYFGGSLDDVRIYPRALQAAEVQVLVDARWQATNLSASGITVMRAGWSADLPDGLEGQYRLDLRSWDQFDNHEARRSAWDGELDTRAPRGTLAYEGGPGTYTYSFSAEDWNLDEGRVDTPCPTSTLATPTYFNAPWYRAVAGATTPNSSRLYSLSGTCEVATANPAGEAMTACDLYGNCTDVHATERTAGAGVTASPDSGTGQVLVLEPAPGAILSSTRPVALSGLATSEAYLKRLSVSVDGKKILNMKWNKQEVQTYNWSADWPPAGAGPQTVTAELMDWDSDRYRHEISFTLDVQPPSVVINTTVLTGTYLFNRPLPIAGAAADENGLASVDVRVQDGGHGSDWTPAALDGAGWLALPYPGPGYQADGAPLTVTTRATDRAGWTTVVTQIVTVDLQPPAPVELEISYDDGTGTRPITRTGTIISTPAPLLQLRWTASGDGSGLAGYRAGWMVEDSSGMTDTVAEYGPNDERLASVQASEGQRLSASVTGRDAYGNRQSQAFSPIYADSPLTPDYIRLDDFGETYRGWMESGCSLLGRDRRANRTEGDGATRGQDQALYATWDDRALRLAWTGANWSGDGDLFVYLDTQPLSGTLDALNPYTTTATLLYLPGMEPGGPRPDAMYADYVVWVQDGATAWLYHWDGAAWAAAGQLGPDQYRFAPGLDGGQTDLYLPFELLGISNPASTPVRLVALATEEGSLSMWAVLPASNPVTSPFITGLPQAEPAGIRLALSHGYRWEGLGDGVCANGSQAAAPGQRQYTDDDLRLSVTVDPTASAYRYLGDQLFAWWETLFGDTPAEFSSLLARVANDQARLHDGQEITYTVQYENSGAEAAHDVVLQLRSRLALILPDGVPLEPEEHIYYQEIPIGDVAPGQGGTTTVRGRVDLAWAESAYQACLVQHPDHPLACAFHKRWALLGIRVYDAAHPPADGPREWMWVDHRVDSEPPLFAGVLGSVYQLSATATNPLRGYAYDESGVVTVTLEVEAPDGATQQRVFTDTVPLDGKWGCGLDLPTGTQDGDVYRLRLRAQDGAGLVSGWTSWRTFVVDRAAPEVTAGSAPTYTLGGPPLSLGVLNLHGQVQDNYGVGGVEVCLDDGRCTSASAQLPVQEWSYSDTPTETVAIGACGVGELVRQFAVPQGGTAVGDLRLGFEVEIADRDRLEVGLTSPAGTTWQLVGDDYDTSTSYANWNVVLADSAPAGLHTLRADQPLTAGGFGGVVRPLQALDVFRGEPAAGTWSLSLCDTSTGQDTAVYYGARLWVEPPNTAPLAGTWRATHRFEALDDVEQTLFVYGIDAAGNRSPTPKALTFRVDNVTPVLTVTQVISQVALQPDLAPVSVLAGTTADGGQVVRLYATIVDPEGYVASARLAVDENLAWHLPLQPMMAGRYQVWIAAEDEAGNRTAAGPFSVDVTCTDAAPVATSLAVEPIAGQPLSLTLTVVISNTGPEPLPAGVPVDVNDGITQTGWVTTTLPLASGDAETLSLVWAPDAPGDYQIGVTAGQNAALPGGSLCVAPPTAHFSVSVSDQALYQGWNLISPWVNPANTDVEVVQRGIDGDYAAILGYDGELRAYSPDDPGGSDLTTVDALHGYWVRTITPTLPPGDPLWGEPAALWRMAGQLLPEDLPLALGEGMNLVSFLPRRPMTVTTALAGIDGQVDEVLGFERTAASYYPDLDLSYNTLANMAPGYGYWISATQAVTLAYPLATISNTLPVSATQMAVERQQAVVAAEWQYGVQPTYQWANFYGPASLPDGTPVPSGTVVMAVSPNGIVCGATAVWQPGQFGLLACYADDPQTTDVDEGAQPGDTIEIWIPSDNTLIGTGVWTAHGNRWEVEQGAQPVVDLAITKEVVPQAALPGVTVSYTLAYSNAGNALAKGVVISEVLPPEILATDYAHAGAQITPTAGYEPYVWQVADLAPGAGGIITVTAVLSPALTGPLAITNTAIISAPLEAQPWDNVAEAVLHVIEQEVPPVVDLAITKQVTPQAALPGALITYTIAYSNLGDLTAQDVVISDILPTEILSAGYSYWGAPITPTAGGPAFVWEVADLAPGEGGVITVTGVLSPELTGTLTITNTAIISAPGEARPENNVAEAILQVILGLASLLFPFLRGLQ